MIKTHFKRTPIPDHLSMTKMNQGLMLIWFVLYKVFLKLKIFQVKRW